MASDSIMDISLQLNIEDISALAEEDVDMEVSAAPTPAPIETYSFTTLPAVTFPPASGSGGLALHSSTAQAVPLSSSDKFNALRLALSSVPNTKIVLEQIKKAQQASNEKLKAAEAELAAAETKLAGKKRAVAEEAAKLKATEEEAKLVESKLADARHRVQSLTKELEELKVHKTSTNNENIADKCKLKIYRQLTGVTFSKFNPNAPSLVQGYAAAPSSSGQIGSVAGLKTFTFNTSEHSASLIGDFIWQLLEDLHGQSWAKAGGPAANSKQTSSN